MEKLKVKHDHTLTDVLKVCIFSLFLILPILMFLPNALYFAFNEHAELSTDLPSVEIENEIEYTYKYKTNTVNTVSDLVQGNSYLITYNGNATQNQYYFNVKYAYKKWKSSLVNNYWYANEFSIGDTYELYSTNNTNTNLTRFYGLNSNNVMSWTGNNFNDFNNGGYLLITYDYSNNTDFFNYFNFSPIPNELNVIENANANSTYTIDYNESTITDVMYKGWQQVWETPLFNWTNSNNFSFTINAFTSVFGITQQSYIANYLCYIFTLIVIYIIYDVVIVLFTKLTHILNT